MMSHCTFQGAVKHVLLYLEHAYAVPDMQYAFPELGL